MGTFVGTGTLYILPEDIGIDFVQSDPKYDLKSIFQDDDFDTPYDFLHDCPYKASEDFYNELRPWYLSLVSMNVRFLSSKWNEVCNFLGGNSDGKLIDFLTIQEVWNVPPNESYKPNGYHKLMYKTRDSTGLNANIGGGVGILVRDIFECNVIEEISIFKPHLFESLFVKVYLN